ncbi:Haloalkane dehalogenase [Pseudovibrio axinellae]|uniref:Haloalkane dehalogenase n=1 Tax=Pseudovibrio axinellae TaxID=989403 RepID=A0A165WQ27_9HYPH|nr:alpha/beta hydrolase [Pseudovibrio axinellae]KZL16782.1 Haloalkane dehalogenase [Pseudovibrio axinellae]SEQ74828.1 Pimeloyl-ACP methyl ester carboxylesterase [Pseudovibrio axinellae]
MFETLEDIDLNLQNLTGTQRITWQASDGLTLSAHIWQNEDPNKPTVLCLPGLTRNTSDFYYLAHFLKENGLRVIAMDYRGRGRSEYADDFLTYNLDQEANDIDRGIHALGLKRFSLLGTSRGGLHAFSMALRNPERLSSVIINDIGPQIGEVALKNITKSVGTTMSQPNMKAAAVHLASVHGQAFTRMSDANWITFANQLYAPGINGVNLRYDKHLGDAILSQNGATPDADLWHSFNALKEIPHLLLRGENSGLLSANTVKKMQEQHQNMELMSIPDQGHAPLLWDHPTQQGILDFIHTHNPK